MGTGCLWDTISLAILRMEFITIYIRLLFYPSFPGRFPNLIDLGILLIFCRVLRDFEILAFLKGTLFIFIKYRNGMYTGCGVQAVRGLGRSPGRK